MYCSNNLTAQRYNTVTFGRNSLRILRPKISNHLGKTHKSIFQGMTSNRRYGGGGFGSGRYRFKNRFFLVIIIEARISVKNGTNIVRNALLT